MHENNVLNSFILSDINELLLVYQKRSLQSNKYIGYY
jgi:hypothetical protein